MSYHERLEETDSESRNAGGSQPVCIEKVTEVRGLRRQYSQILFGCLDLLLCHEGGRGEVGMIEFPGTGKEGPGSESD